MSNDLNKKVIDIFSRHKKNPEKSVKNDLGFNCVVIEKDKNGLKFNSEHLLEYAKNCSYIVRVMKNHGDDTVIYNYNIPNEKFLEFIEKIQSKQIQGTIIEIDKYFPKDLA